MIVGSSFWNFVLLLFLSPSPLSPRFLLANTQEPLNFLLLSLSLASCIRQKKEKAQEESFYSNHAAAAAAEEESLLCFAATIPSAVQRLRESLGGILFLFPVIFASWTSCGRLMAALGHEYKAPRECTISLTLLVTSSRSCQSSVTVDL